MLNWVKQTVGITDHLYGPEGIQSVAAQTKDTPYTELKKDDLAWEVMDGTNVETKTFYVIGDNGHIALVQVIYSNVMGVRTTAQFNSKILAREPGKPHIWTTDNLNHFAFSEDKQSFKADGCSMNLSADGQSYTIESTKNKQAKVDLKFTRIAPGFVAGKNGTSTFGTDPARPWGKINHKFWPRCDVEGSIVTKDGPVDLKGKGIFIHAIQGMKPHFAAAKWNFAYVQSPTYSAVMMEYTTPPSYGATVVNVGGLVSDTEVVFVGASPLTKAEHTEIKGDKDNSWPEPGAVAFTWEGKTKEGSDARVEIKGSLGDRVDRVDVMGELPKFVKQIVAGAAGTKPYIYQYTSKLPLKVTIGGEEKVEEALLYMEATFIS